MNCRLPAGVSGLVAGFAATADGVLPTLCAVADGGGCEEAKREEEESHARAGADAPSPRPRRISWLFMCLTTRRKCGSASMSGYAACHAFDVGAGWMCWSASGSSDASSTGSIAIVGGRLKADLV